MYNFIGILGNNSYNLYGYNFFKTKKIVIVKNKANIHIEHNMRKSLRWNYG